MPHKNERVELEMKIMKYRRRAILFAADDGREAAEEGEGEMRDSGTQLCPIAKIHDLPGMKH